MKITKNVYAMLFLGLSLAITSSLGKLCSGEWKTTEHRKNPGAADRVLGNTGNPEGCRTRCQEDPNCVAVDFYKSSLAIATNCHLYNSYPVALETVQNVVNVRCETQNAEPETSAEPEGTGEPEGEPEWALPEGEEILQWLTDYPEYTAMIGMGIMIILLVITTVVLICCLTRRHKE